MIETNKTICKKYCNIEIGNMFCKYILFAISEDLESVIQDDMYVSVMCPYYLEYIMETNE